MTLEIAVVSSTEIWFTYPLLLTESLVGKVLVVDFFEGLSLGRRGATNTEGIDGRNGLTDHT